MIRRRQYIGVALMTLGATLLAFCYMLHCQSNIELLIGLLMVISGYMVHLWVQKKRGKY